MRKDYDGYISPWGYIGYLILWSIPAIGWLIWLINCFSGNANKKNFARAIFCYAIIEVVVIVLAAAALFALSYFGVAPEITAPVKDYVTGLI